LVEPPLKYSNALNAKTSIKIWRKNSMFDTEKFRRKRIQVTKFNIERSNNVVIISVQGSGILNIQYVEANVRDWIAIVMHLRKNRRCKFLFNVV
jgi:hypothetical protein